MADDRPAFKRSMMQAENKVEEEKKEEEDVV